MAFNPAQPKTPTAIGSITVILAHSPASTDPTTGGEVPETKSAMYWVEILDQNGRRMDIPGNQGNLVPHLSQTDVDWLLDFMSRLRAKAESEFLP